MTTESTASAVLRGDGTAVVTIDGEEQRIERTDDNEAMRAAVELVAELGGGGRGGSQAEDAAAAVAPGAGQGSHRGGLAGSGGGDRQLEAGTGCGHLAHQRNLSRVQRCPVGGRLEQCDVDGRGGGLEAAAASGCVDEPVFGGDDPA